MAVNNRIIAGLFAILAAAGVARVALADESFAPVKAPVEAHRMLDAVNFGRADSEQSHGFGGDHEQLISDGGLDESARQLLPLDQVSWQGGRIAFTLKIDPDAQNYLTVRLWGGEANENRLVLFIDGKQVGYHHIGDVDLIDFGSEGMQAPLLGRFFYVTTPLPLQATRGKQSASLEIRAIGPIWGYGQNFEQYQKDMTGPTRGIYAAYTHTNGDFAPPADEKQGMAPQQPPERQQPGPEVFEQLKARVNHTIEGELRSNKPVNEMEMAFLAEAYYVQWSAAYRNPRVVSQVTRGMDALYESWKADPGLDHDDPVTPNPGWFEFGLAGHAVALLANELTPALDKPLADDAQVARRVAWSQLLRAGLDYHIAHRRLYTNQSMITDLNIAWSNRALQAVDPAQALPAEQVRHWLYQSLGMEPWLGSQGANGPEEPMGDDYFELTPKALTKELGYVGYYGEVLDWVTEIYDATRPAPGEPGDERIRQRAVQIATARAIFRYPALDEDGNRAMRIESIIGWRDAHYPGGVVYVERPSWDASALYITAATLDPALIGGAWQMLDDNQYFQSVADQMKASGNQRVTTGLLHDPDEYDLIRAQPRSATRLPMTSGQPDFAWADEQDGVVAVMQGGHYFYASLYWRARQAINFLARVHDITPSMDRIAVVHEQTEFVPDGEFFTRPDSIDPQAPRGVHYPDDLHSAMAGEKLPIAKLPPGDPRKPGAEDPAAGRGDFYCLRYGDYLIGMNSSTDKTFTLDVPRGFSKIMNLVSKRPIDVSQPLRIGPQSTVVLDLRPNQ